MEVCTLSEVEAVGKMRRKDHLGLKEQQEQRSEVGVKEEVQGAENMHPGLTGGSVLAGRVWRTLNAGLDSDLVK